MEVSHRRARLVLLALGAPLSALGSCNGLRAGVRARCTPLTPLARPLMSSTEPWPADAHAASLSPAAPNGLLVAYKPEGWSSFKVVHAVRRTLQREFPMPMPPAAPGRRRKKPRLKVGHGGTLDPLATGMLVVGVGTGCRALQGYLTGSKAYRARMAFGAETDSQDSTGAVVRQAASEHVSLSALREACAPLRGTILQRPPAFSALRRDGVRSYELARRGELTDADMPEREVHVHALDILSCAREPDGRVEAALEIECGGGVYVRTLIVDLARAVGSAAHMTQLERVKQGPFELDDGALPVLHEAEFDDAGAIVRAMEGAAAVLRSRGADETAEMAAPAAEPSDGAGQPIAGRQAASL